MYELIEIDKSFCDDPQGLLEYCMDMLQDMFPDVGLAIIGNKIYASVVTSQDDLRMMSDAIKTNFEKWLYQFEEGENNKS